MSSTYTLVFGGSAIYPSDVSYLAIALDNDIELEWPLEATGGNNIVARIIDVTPDGIHTITMPDATNVGVGQTVLFNNLGPDIVTVLDLAGNAILSMNAGEQWQIYLVSNTDPSGQWRTFRYGAATAQAQASALAGPGLTALSSVLAANVPVVPFSTTPLTLTAADRAKAFVWTGALGTVNLPSIATATAGWSAHIRNNGTGDLTIDPAGGETINSGSTLTLRPGDSAMLVTDGVEWFTVGLGQQAVFAFDYTVIAVTGGTYTLSGSELNRISYKFTGTLTSSVTVIVPATIQQYWVNNATTGPFSLEIGAVGGGPPVTVPQGESNIYYCDGTDIVQATTTASFGGTLGIGQGGTGSSTANGALTNLGGTGTGISVFTAASASTGRAALLAAAAGANSDITSLSALSTPLSVLQGGTGAGNATTARSNLGAAASGVNSDITALTASAGIQVGAPTGGAQGVGTINAAGLFINGVGVGTGSGSVTSVNASGGTTGLTFTGGPVTTSGTLTVGGTLAAANGGTGQTTYSAGQLLIGRSTGGLARANLTAGSGITITNGDGTITIASSAGGGTVTSVAASGGTTGLSFSGSPITSSGTLTLGGTLGLANGGTGAATASGARLNLGAAASGAVTASGLTMSTARLLGRTSTGSGAVQEISVGSGLTLSAGVLSASATSSGTVTSVALSGGTTGLTVTGSPITTSGTITLGGTLAVANGGTGSTTASGARTNLGATTVGSSFFTLVNPSAIRFIRINADNTVSALDAASFRTAIGSPIRTTVNSVFVPDTAAVFDPAATVAIGSQALQGIDDLAIRNVAVGRGAGANVTAGDDNVLIGDNAGTGITGTMTNVIVIGSGAQANGTSPSNQITLGNSSITALRCQVTTITSLSDERDKTDIEPLNNSLAFVDALEPVRFTWNMRDGGKVGLADTGFTAQQLKAAQVLTGVYIPDLVYEENPDRLEAGYGKLIPVLVGAVKELAARVAELERRGS